METTAISSEDVSDIGDVTSRKLGAFLVNQGFVSPRQLAEARARKLYLGVALQDVLMAQGVVTQAQMASAFARLYKLQIVDLEKEPPDSELLEKFDIPELLQNAYLPWHQNNSTLVAAVADPHKIPELRRRFSNNNQIVEFVLVTYGDLDKAINRACGQQLSHQANTKCPETYSCRRWSGISSRLLAVSVISLIVVLSIILPVFAVNILFGWILLALLANTGFKLFCLITQARPYIAGSFGAPEPAPAPATSFPKVSLLVPVLHEAEILPRLVSRMSALKYPKELLDVCLLVEERDHLTREHLAKTKLPGWMRTIIIPPSHIQTKPRALNYGLNFCRGNIIGVYDAEDAPEPDQIDRVVDHLSRADPQVACVQAVLDYYNTRTNWMSRCFAIEYAVLFRIILKGFDRLRLPLPLGGTSVFFRRHILEEIGGWDAHNVTEDADLGMRLKRLGYRCECINSTTFEEANYRFIPWVRQRSRWLKGFLLTWLTHFRHPLRLYQDLGLKGFLTFHTILLGTVTAYLTAPIVWPLWLLSFGISLPMADLLAPGLFWAVIICFIVSEVFALILNLSALKKPHLGHLRPWAYTMILYSPLGSLAAYKAIAELFIAPSYWDKTQHGLNDALHEKEISQLTGLEPPQDPPRLDKAA